MLIEELLKDDDKELIIYGASVYGEIAFRALEVLGYKPDYYMDRSYEAGQKYFGIPVLDPKSVIEHRHAVILIASADFYYEIFNYLESMDCEHILDIGFLINLDIPESVLSSRALEMYHAKENYLTAVKATELTIIHLGVCVSEKCSLKCKDCSFLMQYYDKPENIDIYKYKSALDKLIECVDFISELRIYGGEPFVNKKIYDLIEWYRDDSKVGVVSIYTNGTIIPDDRTLIALQHPKVKVHISDYEHNMVKAEKLIELLEKKGIDYFIRRYELWQQAGNLEYRNFSDTECRAIFEKCFATNCYSFLKGKFYLCPRAAHAANLHAIHDMSEDYIDFNDLETSTDEFQSKLIKLMHNTKFINACRYCDGLNNHIDGVKPAIQIQKPIKYTKIDE